MSYLWGRFGKDLMQVLASPHLHLKKARKAADFEAKGSFCDADPRHGVLRFSCSQEFHSPRTPRRLRITVRHSEREKYICLSLDSAPNENFQLLESRELCWQPKV